MKQLAAFLLLLAAFSGMAQTAPQRINYQGVARSANGKPFLNQAVGVKFRILQGSSSGTQSLQETVTLTTNTVGVFSTQVGGNGGNLAAINWENGPYFLEVSIDTTGGSAYVLAGTQQLVSVPYALYAGSAPSPTLNYSSNVLMVGNQSVSIVSGGASIPTLAVTGNSISLVGGNAVPMTSVSATGASTATVTGYGYNINTPTVEVAPYSNAAIGLFNGGLLSIVGTYPSYSLAMAPQVSYSQLTGSLVLTNPTVPANSYSFNITPTPTLIGGSLSIGPIGNSISLDPIAPWRQGPNTITMTVAGATQSVGINEQNPTAELHVNGFSRLGGVSAPSVKLYKITGTTALSAGSSTLIPFAGITTAAKIISVSVMVEMTLGASDWTHAGVTQPSNYEFTWNVSGTNVVVTNRSGNSNQILGHALRVLITYEP